MADGETSGLVGEVSLSASLEVAEGVAAEEMEREEPEEWGHTDDDEDEDEINHSALPKGTVRANTPKGRAQKSDIWKHVKRIASHDSLHLGMNVECTHVCVYPLEDCVYPLVRRGFLRVSIFERGCLLNRTIRFSVAKTHQQDRAPVVFHACVSVQVVTGAGRHGWLYRVQRKRGHENGMKFCAPKNSNPSSIVCCVP